MTAGDDKTIKLYDPRTNSHYKILKYNDNKIITSLDFAPYNNDMVLTGSSDHNVNLYSV